MIDKWQLKVDDDMYHIVTSDNKRVVAQILIRGDIDFTNAEQIIKANDLLLEAREAIKNKIGDSDLKNLIIKSLNL
jgi:hypothetical protein